jgi:hypothetical protein
MHLLLHVIGAQSDSNYTAYFPIGVFFVVLGFHIFFFIQRVLGPLLTPTSAVATTGEAPRGSCCASAVPASLNKVRWQLPAASPAFLHIPRVSMCCTCCMMISVCHLSGT